MASFQLRVTVLGSGTSHGIPVVGCSCPVCVSADPRDRRTRASVLVEGPGGEVVVIDTGPEFRLQAVRAGITRLDAVLLTHSHADHLHGLDDIRPLSRERPLPIYGCRATIDDMKARFAYAFQEVPGAGERPRLAPKPVSDFQPVRIGSLVATPLPVNHGPLNILGWRVGVYAPGEGGGGALPVLRGGFLYLTDTTLIAPASRARLRDPEVLIIDGLREKRHDWHFSFDEALSAALALGARRTFLTHLCHEHSHREIETYCRRFLAAHAGELPPPPAPPPEMAPAWDGLTLTLGAPA